MEPSAPGQTAFFVYLASMSRFILSLTFFLISFGIYGQDSGNLIFQQAFDEAPLDSVLNIIDRQNDVNVFYKKDWGIQAFRVNASRDDEVIPILSDLLESAGFSALFYEGNLIIMNKSGLSNYQYEEWDESDRLQDSYQLIGEGRPADAAQPVKVSGFIRDGSDNSPLVGASVQAMETGQGTVTNPNGYYELQLVPGRYEMISQYAGYEQQRLFIQVLNTCSMKLYAWKK